VSVSNLVAASTTGGAPGLGVAVADSGETVEVRQLDLFADPSVATAADEVDLDDLGTERPEERELAQTVDAIRAKFGEGAVASAALVSGSGLRVKRRGDTQWGPSGDG
jgi:hypothetical protein